MEPAHYTLADQIGDILSGKPTNEVFSALLLVLCFMMRQQGLTPATVLPMVQQMYDHTGDAFEVTMRRTN